MADQKDNTAENTENKPIIQKDTSAESRYLSQKCKRLASALYAVTRFLPADEPLRERIRNNALSLVETIRSPANTPVMDTSPADVLARIDDQLSVAKDGGLVSPMNCQILTDEINQLINQLNTSTSSPGPQLSDSFLSVESDPSASERNISRPQSSNNMQPNKTGGSDKQQSESSSPGQSAKEKRRQKILDLFEETDEITVNDATEIIDGYSTKTIQRDLKALVEAGKLEKHGKRRWTSYTRI